MKSISTIKPAILLCIVSLCCLILLEVFSRIYFSPVYPPMYTEDNRYLHKLIPDARKIKVLKKKNGKEKILVTTNSMGFRGNEPRNEVDSRRVIVYGDSFIIAECTALEDTFVTQLEKELSHSLNSPVEAMNAGVIAYGPDQISLRIEDEIEDLKPDVIIVSIFAGNDFGDLLRNKVYSLGVDDELIMNKYVLGKSLRNEFEEAREVFDPDRFINKFMLAKIIKRSYMRLSKKKPDPKKTEDLPEMNRVEKHLEIQKNEYEDFMNNSEVTNLFHDSTDFDIRVKPNSESARYKIKLMEKVILKIKNTIDSRNIPFVLLIIPLGNDVCREYNDVDSSIYSEFASSRATDTLQSIALRHDIRYINLFPHFAKGNCKSYYLIDRGNSHWSTAGQKLAAEIMSELIVSDKLLK